MHASGKLVLGQHRLPSLATCNLCANMFAQCEQSFSVFLFLRVAAWNVIGTHLWLWCKMSKNKFFIPLIKIKFNLKRAKKKMWG